MNGHTYLFFQYFANFGGRVLGPEIIAHSIGMILLLRNVTIPPSTGNFNIPCAMDGMARIFLIPGLPIIPLCWDGDLTTIKFIHAEVECPSSPIFTSKDIWPSGQIVSPLNPVRYVVGGTIWLLISGRSLTKQCSYSISEDAPPSTYIRCTKCPPISASMIIGPSVPSSSPRGGKDIVVFGEKLWVTFCLATFSHGWTIRMASGLSFPAVSPFLGAFGLSFCFSSLMNCDNLPALIISSICFSQLHAFVRTVAGACSPLPPSRSVPVSLRFWIQSNGTPSWFLDSPDSMP
ncbi:hypothetical protein Tco_0524422 [Tanacetum coccineum]